MCKVVPYIVVDVMFVISLHFLSYNKYQFYYHFNVDTKSKTPYLLTSSINLPASFSSFSKEFIITTTPTVIEGKQAKILFSQILDLLSHI